MNKTLSAIAATAALALWTAGAATAATVSLVDSTGTKTNATLTYTGNDSDILGYFNNAWNNLLSEIYAAGNNAYESDIVEAAAGLPSGSVNLGSTELPGSNPGTMWTVPGSTYFTVKYAQSLFVLWNTSASSIDVTYATDPNCTSNFADNECSDSVSHSKHLTVTTYSPVPLPAAAWMLLAAVGGLAALRRRNKA